jgi:tellurite methyltransferase
MAADPVRSPWGRVYTETPDRYIWGTAPSRFAFTIGQLLPPGARVLDLGCGEGRDSVYFASLGYDVTGVELSEAGLRKAERLEAAAVRIHPALRLRWICGAMEQVEVGGPFDLVYSCGSIHYVPRAARSPLIARLRERTRPGGYHAHIVFTDRAVYVEEGEVIDYFAPGEIGGFYEGWTTERHSEGAISCAQDGTAHQHSVEEIVARAVGRRRLAQPRKVFITSTSSKARAGGLSIA